MGNLGSIRLAAHGNQTPITPSNIYFLDNRLHPLATSQKVCDAWRKQSEAKGRRLCARRWSTPGLSLASARKNWRSNSDITSPSWHVLKVGSAGLTLLSWLFWHALLVLTHLRFWQWLKPPQNLITEFETI